MACAPCREARAAALSAVRSAATMDLRALRKDVGNLRAALSEKVEAMRVRIITQRKQ